MKKELLNIAFFIPLLFTSCSKEVEHDLIKTDNSKQIQNANINYEYSSKLEYKYDYYENVQTETPIKLAQTHVAGIRYDSSGVDFECVLDNFKCELPHKIINQKKYVVKVSEAYTIYESTPRKSYEHFATDSFAEYFDIFLESVDYKKINEDFKEIIFLYVFTDNFTYTIYSDGSIKVSFSDGDYISNQKLDIFKIMIEVINLYTYLDLSTPFNYFFSNRIFLRYRGIEKELGTLKSIYYGIRYVNTYHSVLFNTKIFDYSKMLEISYVDNDSGQTYNYYLTRDGVLIHERNPFMIRGIDVWDHLYSDSKIYHCDHIEEIDINKLFALFDE